MTTERFQAETNYNDWQGTISAEIDVDHLRGVRELLEDQRRLGDNDRVVGVRLWVGELVSTGPRIPTVEAIIVTLPEGENDVRKWLGEQRDPIPVRKVELSCTLQQFFDFYRRCEVVLTSRNLNLEGRSYKFPDE